MENPAGGVTNDFRGLKWAPSYEQEVVLLFGLLLPYFDKAITVDECRESFPDCIGILSSLGSPVRIEFELNSSNFLQHGHDPAGCDMIVCWHHDWASCPQTIEVVELSSLLKDRRLPFVLNPDRSKYPSVTWDEETFFKAAGPNPKGYIRELYDFCCSHSGLSVSFGHGSKQATFTVKTIAPESPRSVVFGVNADGSIWTSFIGFPDHVSSQYRAQLSQIDRIRTSAKRKEWFNFTIASEPELEVVKNTLRWLCTVRW